MKRILLPVTLCLCLGACRNAEQTLFREVAPGQSGLTFANQVREDKMINMLTYEYLYNGGGVGIGDFNNDGRPDIYLTASMGPNALYLNEGGFRFRDVTAVAGVDGQKRWSRGVAVVDINNDGLHDIYVCAGTWQVPDLRRNLLYVNQGVDPATGIPRFAESAAEYRVDDTTNTQMAAFFDYDRDGDLDLYLLVNDLGQEKPNTFRPVRNDGSARNTDKLLRNDWDPVRQHAVYTDVSRQAGITWEGYGLGLQILDINEDGWKDILVSNDYLTGDILYINDRKGGFTNRVGEYFAKGSLNAMGNDAADINNDGLVDIIETDMAGEDNTRFKMMMNPLDHNWYRYSKQFGLQYQTVRNTLQLNRGPRIMQGDSIGAPFFSETAFLAGVAYTDWSWAPLLADLDQDGYRDLMVANGLPKDITDNDFISYREQKSGATPDELLLRLPPVKVSNYLFRNNGDLTFSDKTIAWGWDRPTFSNGMAYADLDGDGDLDLVTNNINMPAGIWENRADRSNPGKANYLRFRCRGDTSNIHGLGTVVRIHHDGRLQVAELTPYRGYLSSVEPVLHFGLGASQKADSVVIRWPDGRQETLRDVPAGQTVLLSQASDAGYAAPRWGLTENNNLLRDVSQHAGIFFVHRQEDHPDFDLQRGLPHKLSDLAPPLAAGDLNGDGLEDLVVGGNATQKSFLYFQQADGRFRATLFNSNDTPQTHEDASAALLDADADGDADIYLAAGGARFPREDARYQDHLWLNDGKGFFREAPAGAIPLIRAGKSVARVADVNNDGRPDLFLGGRPVPGAYPTPGNGHLLLNRGGEGQPRFHDATSELAPELSGMGLVTDAVWADIDGDRDPDLLLSGEWTGITLFRNEGGRLVKRGTEMDKRKGWWNALSVADLDGDGDLDIVAGNYGRNGFFRATDREPVRAYANDYDGNGIPNLLLGHYRPVRPHGPRAEFPVSMRDGLVEELPQLKKYYPTYAGFAAATMAEVLDRFDRKGERVLEAVCLESGWFEQTEGGHFTFHALPVEAQLAPVFGILIRDLDGDGITDILLTGNQEGEATIPGRSDAFCGLVLKGLGKGGFSALTILQSGLFLPGNARQVQPLRLGPQDAFAISQHNGALKLYLPRNGH